MDSNGAMKKYSPALTIPKGAEIPGISPFSGRGIGRGGAVSLRRIWIVQNKSTP